MTTNPHGLEPDPNDAPASQSDLMAGIAELFNKIGDVDMTPQALQRQRTEMARAQKREANIFRDTFATEAGQKCLKLMREMTLEAEPYPIGANLPLEAITAMVIAHDAQCRFVRAIAQAIDFANNMKDGNDE